VLYATIWTKLDGYWYHTPDAAFMKQGSTVTGAQMLYPLDGATAVDTAQPFQWSEVGVAQAYRLEIFNGEVLLHDSGEIQMPRRFVGNLPLGVPLRGRLSTKILGQWHVQEFGFTASANNSSAEPEVQSALWATDYVRCMADERNFPYGGTLLEAHKAFAREQVQCSNYMATLLTALQQMNVAAGAPATLQPRRINISFTGLNGVHTLVEMYNRVQQSWMILDPTIVLSARRADGQWASQYDIQAATLAKRWNDISYVFLGSQGNQYARNYLFDYPLLYLNIPMPADIRVGHDVLPYLEEVTGPIENRNDVYMVQCAQPTVQLLIDGKLTTVNCNIIQNLAQAFRARSISLPPGSSAQVKFFRVTRAVF
jgi:hypothetical protein